MLSPALPAWCANSTRLMSAGEPPRLRAHLERTASDPLVIGASLPPLAQLNLKGAPRERRQRELTGLLRLSCLSASYEIAPALEAERFFRLVACRAFSFVGRRTNLLLFAVQAAIPIESCVAHYAPAAQRDDAIR